MSKHYCYIRETKYITAQEARNAAYYDIENDRAEPIEIVDEQGDIATLNDIALTSENIYNQFYLSDHDPIAPPTIRARAVNKQEQPAHVGWFTKLKSRINNALYGNPGHWS